jgi:hypothetical protein
MSAAGKAMDAFASRAKPRRAARGCERGRRPTLHSRTATSCKEGARRAHRRAMAEVADARNGPSHFWTNEATP